jgi:hypothetical protein
MRVVRSSKIGEQRNHEKLTPTGFDYRTFWFNLRDIFYPPEPGIEQFFFRAQRNLHGPVAVYGRLRCFAVSLVQTETDAGFIPGPVFIFDGFPGAIH